MTRALFLALALATPAMAAPDAATKAWWQTTTALSDDSMEGRDTGSPGHARAVAMIAARFKAAKLQPAGENGGWTQTLSLHEWKIEPDGTRIVIVQPGKSVPLKFLHDVSLRAGPGLPATIDAAMVFGGYCSAAELGDSVRGKVAVCFGNRRTGLPLAAERNTAATAAGAIAIVTVDDREFAVEPPRWPDAYARTIVATDQSAPSPAIPQFRLNAASFAALIDGSGHLASAVLTDGGLSRPLESFALPGRLSATIKVSERDLASDNVLALLPGTDPTLSAQVVVVSAHSDGYGRGEAVGGDDLYNGSFDDAAYVATLIQLADARRGKGFRRPVLFAVFTGEEKGLLGARWFVRQPTVPKASLAANINLDGLRPLFPLRRLTMLGMAESNLINTVRAVATPLNITMQADPEPERGMNGRTDHAAFLAAGIPATAFIFGYAPRTPEAVIYRKWVNTRYHRPQDDPAQPYDAKAAADFNRFFANLTAAVADGAEPPRMTK